MSENLIFKRGGSCQRDVLPDHIAAAAGQFLFNLLLGIEFAGIVIFERFTAGFLQFSLGIDLILIAEAVMGAAKNYQFFRIFHVNAGFHAVGLDIRTDRAADIRAFIMIQMALFQSFIDNIRSAFDKTPLVRIFNAEDKYSVRVLFGHKIGIKRRPQVADMHIAGRTGRESGTYFCHVHAPFLHINFTLKNDILQLNYPRESV